jgi:hypothetical protein
VSMSAMKAAGQLTPMTTPPLLPASPLPAETPSYTYLVESLSI